MSADARATTTSPRAVSVQGSWQDVRNPPEGWALVAVAAPNSKIESKCRCSDPPGLHVYDAPFKVDVRDVIFFRKMFLENFGEGQYGDKDVLVLII